MGCMEMFANGVFHRDIKKENILVQPTDDGIRVRIVDFGCSALLEDEYEWDYRGETFDFYNLLLFCLRPFLKCPHFLDTQTAQTPHSQFKVDFSNSELTFKLCFSQE